MKAEKSIDLGKLQDELNNAKRMRTKQNFALNAANSKLQSAQRAYDAAKKKWTTAQNAVDSAETAVLEAARTIANG
jgi:hypothetical protein